MDKLRAEKRSFLEYQKATEALEKFTRLVKAYDWTMTVERVEKATEGLSRRRTEIEGLKEDIMRGGKECEDMEGEVKEIQKRREKVCLYCLLFGAGGAPSEVEQH